MMDEDAATEIATLFRRTRSARGACEVRSRGVRGRGTSPPRIFVSKVPQGVHAAREEGDTLKLVRWDFDPRAGLTRGYWIVRSEREWRDLWPSIDADRIPLLPPGINFGSEMLLVAAPPDAAATGARIHQVIDTPEAGVHVYVSQVLPGSAAPRRERGREGRSPWTSSRVRVLNKELHFHVDTKNEDACSPPSEAKVACRVDGSADDYKEKLSVEPGKTVSCLSQGKLGSRATIERTWSFRALPQGTTAKMTIAEGEGSIRFSDRRLRDVRDRARRDRRPRAHLARDDGSERGAGEGRARRPDAVDEIPAGGRPEHVPARRAPPRRREGAPAAAPGRLLPLRSRRGPTRGSSSTATAPSRTHAPRRGATRASSRRRRSRKCRSTPTRCTGSESTTWTIATPGSRSYACARSAARSRPSGATTRSAPKGTGGTWGASTRRRASSPFPRRHRRRSRRRPRPPRPHRRRRLPAGPPARRPPRRRSSPPASSAAPPPPKPPAAPKPKGSAEPWTP